jgi:hypothetical protein
MSDYDFDRYIHMDEEIEEFKTAMAEARAQRHALYVAKKAKENADKSWKTELRQRISDVYNQ